MRLDISLHIEWELRHWDIDTDMSIHEIGGTIPVDSNLIDPSSIKSICYIWILRILPEECMHSRREVIGDILPRRHS